jgi:hypothetical protein
MNLSLIYDENVLSISPMLSLVIYDSVSNYLGML